MTLQLILFLAYLNAAYPRTAQPIVMVGEVLQVRAERRS